MKLRKDGASISLAGKVGLAGNKKPSREGWAFACEGRRGYGVID
jgi:hypothetical protein